VAFATKWHGLGRYTDRFLQEKKHSKGNLEKAKPCAKLVNIVFINYSDNLPLSPQVIFCFGENSRYTSTKIQQSVELFYKFEKWHIC